MTREYVQGKHLHNFKKVADPENWKMPTKAKVVATNEEAMAIQIAVGYYTGSLASVVKLDENNYGVNEASGYYAEIGA